MVEIVFYSKHRQNSLTDPGASAIVAHHAAHSVTAPDINVSNSLFDTRRFRYDPAANAYDCCGGHMLDTRRCSVTPAFAAGGGQVSGGPMMGATWSASPAAGRCMSGEPFVRDGRVGKVEERFPSQAGLQADALLIRFDAAGRRRTRNFLEHGSQASS